MIICPCGQWNVPHKYVYSMGSMTIIDLNNIVQVIH